MHNLCKLIKLITQISQGFGLFFLWSINPPSLPPPKSVYHYWHLQQTLFLLVVANYLKTLSGNRFLFQTLALKLQDAEGAGESKTVGSPPRETQFI